MIEIQEAGDEACPHDRRQSEKSSRVSPQGVIDPGEERREDEEAGT
jgi:hypothetical protein